MTNLANLKAAADAAEKAFDDACRPHYCDGRWGYYRECERDPKRPPQSVHAAADAYHEAIQAFYLARDGERGFLGQRGL